MEFIHLLYTLYFSVLAGETIKELTDELRYDTSQTSIDFVTFPTPQHTRPPTQKHSSLHRDTTPSIMSFNGNTSRTPEVPSHVPIIFTQDSGITSSFDRSAPSVSSYSLSTDVGSSASNYGAIALDPASEVSCWV